MRRLGLPVLIVLAASVLGGCSSADLSPSSLALNGVWAGQLSDSSGAATITAALTQDGSSLSGLVTIEDPDTSFRGHGTITGTVTGTSLTFAIHVPAGGFDDPYRTCSADVTGSGDIASTVTGRYTGSNSCSGPITTGQLTLAKQ